MFILILILGGATNVYAEFSQIEKLKAGCSKGIEDQCRLLRKECGPKNSMACLYLGLAKVQADEMEDAIAYFSTSCEYGNAQACGVLTDAGLPTSRKENDSRQAELESLRQQKEYLNSQNNLNRVRQQDAANAALIGLVNGPTPVPQVQPKRMKCQYSSAWLPGSPNYGKDVRSECTEY